LTVNVVVQQLPAFITLKEFFMLSLLGVEGQIEEYREHGRGEALLGGIPSQWLNFSGRQNALDFQAVTYFLVGKERGFIITCLTARQNFDRALPTFRRIAESFRLEEGAPVSTPSRPGTEDKRTPPVGPTPAPEPRPEERPFLLEEAPVSASPERSGIQIQVRPGTEDGPAPPVGPTPAPEPRPEERSFFLSVEQDGRQVPIENRRVRLRKRPFVLVIYLRGLDGLLVNCSSRSTSFTAAAEGRPLREMPWYNGEALLEGYGNGAQEIAVMEDRFHYWFYANAHSHRFDLDGLRAAGEWTACRRTISRVRYGARQSAMPIESYPEDILYITMVKSGLPSRFHEVSSYQAEWLEVRFR
ncbi:MAG: hypothetical protein ACM3XS_04575, partial [Bacteroidota bacterium]